MISNLFKPIATRRDDVWNTPWKLRGELHRLLLYPFVRLLFVRNRIPWGDGWRFYGAPIIQKHRHSVMRFGDGLQLRSHLRSNPLAPLHPVFLTTWKAGAVLEIGSGFGMTGGVLCAASRITIGHHVTVGANCTIVDSDFHPIRLEDRYTAPNEGARAPITIEDDVFVGMHCQILKGVTIGKQSVVGAGSVVTRDVPAGVVVAGNPAQIVKEI